MRKYVNIFLMFVFVFGIVGCGTSKKELINHVNDNKGDYDMTINERELVVYFSATGITKSVAQKVAEVTKSDIVEIIPKQKYTDEDLNYDNNNCRANQEQNDSSSRPEIQNDINIESYKRIYIGYPIWWGTNPRIILTLLDHYNFDDKEVVLFCTSGGSGISQSVDDLKVYNKKMKVLDGRRFSSSVSNSEIESWINGLNNLEINSLFENFG